MNALSCRDAHSDFCTFDRVSDGVWNDAPRTEKFFSVCEASGAYWLNDGFSTWDKAQSTCAATHPGGHLAVIPSSAANAKVRRQFHWAIQPVVDTAINYYHSKTLIGNGEWMGHAIL